MEIPNITDLRLDKACRTCLQERTEMHSVFSEIRIQDSLDDSSFIYEIVMSTTSMKIIPGDGLPAMICTPCMELAHTAFRFQQQCNRSHSILEHYLNQERDTLYNNMIETDIDLTNPMDFLQTDSPELDYNLKVNNSFQDFQKKDSKYNSDSKIEEIDFKNLENCTDKDKEVLITKENPKKKLLMNGKFTRRKVRRNITCYTNSDYACNSCGKYFKHLSSLKIHMRSHSHERPHVCQICGKGFKQYGALSYHVRSHTGEQPYACKICGKRYKQSGTLTAHMRVHTGQKPFLCSVCGRGFRQAADLGYHMRTHNKEKPYMCSICGKTMRMQCHLVQHMRTHTGERPFKCLDCGKAFPSTSRLKRHEIVHTGLKPFTCEVCNKSFNRSSTLRVHSKIHTDERPHVCSVCGKGFIQAHALRTHLLTHKLTQPSEELASKVLVFIKDVYVAD